MGAIFGWGPPRSTEALQPTKTVYLCTQGSFTDDEFGEVPVLPDMPGVKGIFLGGCVDTRQPGNISKRCSALAHAHISGRNKGWVCFQLPEYYHDPKHRWVRMHELAHIMSGQGHTDKWREAMMKLGQEIPPRYQRRQRGKNTS